MLIQTEKRAIEARLTVHIFIFCACSCLQGVF